MVKFTPLVVAAIIATTAAADAQSHTAIAPGASYRKWEPIKEIGIQWRKRVWREVDMTEATNAFFNAPAMGNALIDVLMTGAKDKSIQVYSSIGDRFTTTLAYDQLVAQLKDKTLLAGVDGKQCANMNYMPSAVHKYIIKEDWLFLREEKKMVVRIVGIAPVGKVVGPDGAIADQPLFWCYYPDSREFLSRYAVAVAGQETTWEAVFGTRTFKSTIVKAGDTRVREEIGPGMYQWQKQ
ncbi:MAG: hypothetical protein V4649_06410 [Bacteroidota bacterium]